MTEFDAAEMKRQFDVAEANRQRAHDAEQRERERDRMSAERIARSKIEQTRVRWERAGYWGVGAGCVLMVLAFLLALCWNVERGREADLRERDQQQEQMQACVATGGAWTQGNCIPTVKER